ncbi:ATP-dependent DNA helicase [Frankliniella fusca]|uniref:ATP-dependent DNA helicase n=1 Tax=Frankliniella fusca TaxID=407009 RepID=A0AAE1HMR9_9NEOP|nr:ATP-dependent DNA helicase [Frankliniella fusca]
MWNNFQVFRLTKIMGQNEKNFQTALNNLAKGKLTRKDLTLFKSRTFTKTPKKQNLHKAIHLFPRNQDVDAYNVKVLKKIKGEETSCTASDVFHGHGSQLAKRQMEYSISESIPHQTMGLCKSLSLKVGAIYMVTYNIDTQDGICNGATGVLKKIQSIWNKSQRR